MRKLLLIGFAVLALGFAACGDDDDDGTTPTAESTDVTVEEPTITAEPTTDEASGETADLPLCDEAGSVRPCRTEGGAVLEEGGENGGEVGDLPLCSEAEPPCRNPDGSFVEP